MVYYRGESGRLTLVCQDNFAPTDNFAQVAEILTLGSLSFSHEATGCQEELAALIRMRQSLSRWNR